VRAFLRENQEPFPGAGVWAIGADSVETLKAELGQLKQDSSRPDVEKDYESIIGNHGAYLGRTGQDGRLACTLEQAGRYILVAARNGYVPGFTHIGVRDTISALGIRTPKRAPVGQPVSMGVFDRITQNPVAGAGIWAVTRDDIEALKQEAQALKEDAVVAAEEKDYESLVNARGLFLGRTDENGKLDYTFNDAGAYLLVAVKRGYFPGFSPLAVIEKPKVLAIKATPPQTHVGKEVTLNVSDRQAKAPVEGAGVWAMSRDEAETLKQEIAALREDTATAAAGKDYEAVVSLHGTFLGRTDADGKLGATFDTAGNYLLVTVKHGYIPGFTVLPVREMPEPSTTTNATRSQKQPNLKAFRPNAVEIR
jgi:hypothetical protein